MVRSSLWSIPSHHLYPAPWAPPFSARHPKAQWLLWHTQHIPLHTMPSYTALSSLLESSGSLRPFLPTGDSSLGPQRLASHSTVADWPSFPERGCPPHCGHSGALTHPGLPSSQCLPSMPDMLPRATGLSRGPPAPWWQDQARAESHHTSVSCLNTPGLEGNSMPNPSGPAC